MSAGPRTSKATARATTCSRRLRGASGKPCARRLDAWRLSRWELVAGHDLRGLHHEEVAVRAVAEDILEVLGPVERHHEVAGALPLRDRHGEDHRMRDVRGIGRVQEAEEAHAQVVDAVAATVRRPFVAGARAEDVPLAA